MTRSADVRAQVQSLDEQGWTPSRIATTLGISTARVDVVLDSLDPPHPERDRAPVLEPLGGPAVVTSQSAVGGGRDKDPTRPKRIRTKAEPKPVKAVECGTVAGYYQHRKLKDGICQLCRDAYNTDRREGRPPRPKVVVECGTPAGRNKHKRAGEKPCEPCRLAYNAWQRGQYELYGGVTKSSRKPIEHGTPAGLRAHSRRGEKPCEDCLKASNESKWKPITHGTRAGYVQHRRRQEDPCKECLAANAAASKASKKRSAA